jgi:RNA 2',3'-cyclic 3'-phosphodiesterase
VRLFVALEISSAVRETLAAMIDELRAADAPSSKTKARWVRAENVHVTLKFIGHVDAGKLDAIRTELAEIRSDAPVELHFRGIGFFPNDRRPRVFWAGVEASPNLATLAGEIDARLSRVGIPCETRAFAPHLTLARFDPPSISEALRAAARKNGAREFGSVRTGEFHFFESKTRPTGADYTHLSSFSFVKGSSLKAEG